MNKLEDSWTLYYKNQDSSWDAENIKPIYTFNTIEEFWSLHDIYIPKQMYTQTFLFLMRHNYAPLWEAPENIIGGCWSIIISKKISQSTWHELAMSLVGETLFTTPDSKCKIVGISFTPRQKVINIKIWNNNSKYSDISLLNTKIPKLDFKQAIYTAYLDKLNKK